MGDCGWRRRPQETERPTGLRVECVDGSELLPVFGEVTGDEGFAELFRMRGVLPSVPEVRVEMGFGGPQNAQSLGGLDALPG